MNRFALALSIVLAAAGLGGCDDDDSTNRGGMDLAVTLFPAPPTLGMEIDRMGRAAINTALNHAFDPVDATKNAAKDKYNAEGNPANWEPTTSFGGEFVAEFATNLAIIDGLDGTCGNQLLAPGVGADAAASAYTKLASLLLDDELYLDTSIVKCSPTTVGAQTVPNYFAVEARSLGLPFTACGGRTPLDDAIDVSLSLLAKGVDGVVSDGIDRDADPASGASLTDFPFLNAPN